MLSAIPKNAFKCILSGVQKLFKNFEKVDIIGQNFHIDQKMRNKISHLLISMSSQRATEEKGYRMKNRPKIENNLG